MLAGFKTPRLTQRPSYPLKPGGGAVAVQAGVLWMVYLIYFFDPPPGFSFLAHIAQTVCIFMWSSFSRVFSSHEDFASFGLTVSPVLLHNVTNTHLNH